MTVRTFRLRVLFLEIDDGRVKYETTSLSEDTALLCSTLLRKKRIPTSRAHIRTQPRGLELLMLQL